MCGILAWYSPEPSEDRLLRVTEATRRMSHRGPDGEGFWLRGGIALGHRRLSILDAGGGHQPMERGRGRFVLTYNGEIYNYREIARELAARGAVLQTRSDTEVILAAYEEWGSDCVHRFVGMFSFALWDAEKERLWVVRDRLGVKPLYYTTDAKGGFACASGIGPLFTLGIARPQLNEAGLDAYFTLGYVPAPETLFQGIRKLEPGHELLIDRSGVVERVYWDCAAAAAESWSEQECLDRLGPLLEDAVSGCLVSDVPLGAFLSGGLDSSAIVALMHRCGVRPVHTLTAGFARSGETCESSWAGLVARHFDCRHELVDLPPEDFLDGIATLVRHTEEPLVEPSGIALHQLAKHARPELAVMLSGEGADEVFGGYGLYRRMLRLGHLRRVLPLGAGGLLRRLSRGGKDAWVKYADWFDLPLEESYRGTSALLSDGLRERFYEPAFNEARGTYLESTFARHFARVPLEAGPLARMLYVDRRTWLADDLLLKADKMTMAASVELRVPFLDHRVVEMAARLPSRLLIRGREGKWILRQAMARELPQPILQRRKMGFPVPVGSWFSGPLRETLRERLLEHDSLPWFRRPAIVDLIENDRDRTEGRNRLLMGLVVLEEWRRQFGV